MAQEYEVGYRKPPKTTRFKAGKSGNPRGRPKGSTNLATDLSAELSEQITIREGGQGRLRAKVRFAFLMYEGRTVKTATDRAAEAIEAAEIMFADEMGATLDLSP